MVVVVTDGFRGIVERGKEEKQQVPGDLIAQTKVDGKMTWYGKCKIQFGIKHVKCTKKSAEEGCIITLAFSTSNKNDQQSMNHS